MITMPNPIRTHRDKDKLRQNKIKIKLILV